MLSIKKIGVIGRTYRHLNRYRQILTVLFKYGYGDLIDRLKIDQYIEIGLQMISRKSRERVEKLTRAERIRMALEELGPTYVKLGQILSSRPDLVAADFIQEFSKLQDKVPPFPFIDAKEIIQSELGSTLGSLFDYFDEKPFASASIGQVHRARLQDGEEVAVKVQRPGITKVIEVDLEIMLHLATLMERHIEEMELQRPVKIVEEFAKTIEKEIDYTIEATSMQRVAMQFLDDPNIYIPKVFSDKSTELILTTEFVDGIKVSEIDRIEDAGLDRNVITVRGTELSLKQVFEYGFFHADPHPGNIFVLPNNVICLIDFGMMGSVDTFTKERFVDLLDSIVRKDVSKAAQTILKLTTWDEAPDVRFFEKDVSEFMMQHLYKPLKDIKIGKLLQNVIELTSRHRLTVLPDLFLMMKALTTVEGVALMLDPDFDMIGHTKPFIKRAILERFTPKRIAGNFYNLASEILQFMQQFPKDALEITTLLKSKKLSLNLEHRGLETMLSTYDQISNRVSFSIIIAALIIGSALIVISDVPPLFYGISLIGIVGFLTAAVMGMWLLIAILRKGRL